MSQFTPCRGTAVCQETATHCPGCGRSHEEILWLRDLIDQLTSLSSEYGYQNVDDYCEYVAYALKESIDHRRNI